VSGKLLVVKSNWTYSLMAGQGLTMPVGEWHQFHAVTDVELIETYWLNAIDPDDIERQ